MRELRIVKLPPAPDLLNQIAPLSLTIRDALRDSGKPAPVLIFQASEEPPDSYYLPLRFAHVMHDELYANLKKFYLLLQEIRAARIPTVFCGQGNCYSMLCELALTCHLRIWQNALGHLGFPEARIGAIAPSLFDLKSRNPQLVSPWNEASVVSIISALNRGIVEAIMQFDQLQEFLRLSTEGTLTSWQSRSRSTIPTGQSQEKGQIQLYCQSMLNEQTQLSMARQPLPQEESLDRKPLVVFDISFALPPTTSLIRALQQSAKVVFTANESLSLTGGLETIFSRLQRALSPQLFISYWNHQILWIPPSKVRPLYPTFHWLSEDTLELHLDDEIVELSLSGGHEIPGARELPVCEIITRTPSPRVHQALRLITHQIIQAQPTEELSLTQYLRLSILVEICRMAKQSDGKLLTICDHLRKSGWLIVGNDIFWQRFLVSADISTHPILKGLVGKSSEHAAVSWRELVLWCERKDSKAGASRSAIATSQHLAIFVWHQVQRHIIPRLTTSSAADSSSPMSHSVWQWSIPVVGFPLAYGTPLQYAMSWNQRRIDHTIRTYWSHETSALPSTHS